MTRRAIAHAALPGEMFGRWTVVGTAEPSPRHEPRRRCRCTCGAERPVLVNSLLRGVSTGCGCVREGNVRHGGARARAPRTPEYSTWQAMRKRCANPRAPEYHSYGGRGIQVCERWNDFAAFLADMGPKPSPGHTIDRLDPDGNYEPANCRWATRQEQTRNRRTSHMVTVEGISRPMADWADRVGIPYTTLRSRLRDGWNDADAVFTPVRAKPAGAA